MTQQQQTAIDTPVSINNLTFQYTLLEGKPVMKELSLSLPRGVRCLLVGSNGAGKSTLLNVLGGKHMHAESAVSILGQPAFSNTHPGVTVLSGQWSKVMVMGGSVPYQTDVLVESMIDQAVSKGDVTPERLAKLLYILDVNMKWRMHQVSDGQRRRVQILMALMKPFEVLLLDEVTVDLDVVARADLLDFLKQETEERGATVLYATHIFDGLDDWATHLAYQTEGAVSRFSELNEYEEFKSLQVAGSKAPLLEMVEQWLRVERGVLKQERLAAEEEAKGKQQEKDLRLSKKSKNKNDPFAGNRMYNYW